MLKLFITQLASKFIIIYSIHLIAYLLNSYTQYSLEDNISLLFETF